MAKSKKKGRSEKGKGTLVKRGTNWYFRITVDGREYTHPTRTDDWEQAKRERDRFLRTLRPILPNSLRPLHETVTVSELVDDYIDYRKANGRRSVEDIERALQVNVPQAELFQGRWPLPLPPKTCKSIETCANRWVEKRPRSITNSPTCAPPSSMG